MYIAGLGYMIFNWHSYAQWFTGEHPLYRAGAGGQNAPGPGRRLFVVYAAGQPLVQTTAHSERVSRIADIATAVGLASPWLSVLSARRVARLPAR